MSKSHATSVAHNRSNVPVDARLRVFARVESRLESDDTLYRPLRRPIRHWRKGCFTLPTTDIAHGVAEHIRSRPRAVPCRPGNPGPLGAHHPSPSESARRQTKPVTTPLHPAVTRSVGAIPRPLAIPTPEYTHSRSVKRQQSIKRDQHGHLLSLTLIGNGIGNSARIAHGIALKGRLNVCCVLVDVRHHHHDVGGCKLGSASKAANS